MKKTAQFGLNQWEMSDRIQMQDFNRDNAAIEAALAKRNCQFYTASYIGDGEATKSWTFPAKPVLVVIIGQVITVLIRDFSIGITQFGSSTISFRPHGRKTALHGSIQIIPALFRLTERTTATAYLLF